MRILSQLFAIFALTFSGMLVLCLYVIHSNYPEIKIHWPTVYWIMYWIMGIDFILQLILIVLLLDNENAKDKLKSFEKEYQTNKSLNKKLLEQLTINMEWAERILNHNLGESLRGPANKEKWNRFQNTLVILKKRKDLQNAIEKEK